MNNINEAKSICRVPVNEHWDNTMYSMHPHCSQSGTGLAYSDYLSHQACYASIVVSIETRPVCGSEDLVVGVQDVRHARHAGAKYLLQPYHALLRSALKCCVCSWQHGRIFRGKRSRDALLARLHTAATRCHSRKRSRLEGSKT